MSLFAPYAEIRGWRMESQRWPFWWTASVRINGGERIVRFRARSNDAADEKAIRWIDAEGAR